LAVLKGDGSSLAALPVSFAIIAEQGGRLVGWLVGKGKKKMKRRRSTWWCLFVCLFSFGKKGCKERENKKPKRNWEQQ
jgi:hypothetical protein